MRPSVRHRARYNVSALPGSIQSRGDRLVGRVKRDATDTPVPQKILDASMKVFGAMGYESASMKAIATEAGVTPAALYYHYKDKQELLAEGLKTLAQGVLDAVEATPQEIARDPIRALERFVQQYITYQLTVIRETAPMYSSLVHGVNRKRGGLTAKQVKSLRQIEHRHLDLLKAILDTGKAQGHFKFESTTVTAFAIIGMCEHTLSWVNPTGKLRVEDIARSFSRLALRLVSGH